MPGAEVSIRGAKASISGQVNIRPLSCTVDSPDICDRSSRILGIVSGNLAQLQQRPVTNELLVQLRNAGVDIDPRQIRPLTCSDQIDVCDRPSRQLGIAGRNWLLTCSDAVDICDRANRQLGIAGRNWTLNSTTDSVTVVNALFPTTPINDFNQAPNVARMTSSTHTYTTTGNFKLSSIEASASGAMKIEVKAGNAGLETTKMIAFTSPANPLVQLRFNEELQLTVGQRILVIRTNRENNSMDMFSTILGFNT